MLSASFLKKLSIFLLFLALLIFSQGIFPAQATLNDVPPCVDGTTQDCGACGVQICANGVWGECHETPKPDTSETEYWNEYRCQGQGCGKEYIEKRLCSKSRTRTCSCIGGGKWSCGEWSDWSDPSCRVIGAVECNLPWQTCQNGQNWSRAKPSCQCAGQCLEVPKNPRYYNNPNYPKDPKNPEPSLDPNNIFLPVKLDWDDVKGWNQKTGPQSYVINIKNTRPQNPFNTTTTNSEFIPPSCTLRSGASHPWQVRACCSNDGQNCGPKSAWSFNTNLAPELKSPLDPDWTGKDRIKNQALDVKLKWCDVFFQKKIGPGETIPEKPKSFRLFFYLGYHEPDKEEIIIHHPATPNDFPKVLSDRLYRKTQPIFSNERYGFFTKPPFLYKGIKYNFYAWRVAACERFDGRGRCTNFSQKWRFSLDEDIELKIPEGVRPPNNIKIPVEFPVIFEWKPILGANSYVFKIRKEGEDFKSKIVLGSGHSIDYPKLVLNTVYQWRVKACTDFEGIKCEPSWSLVYSFKTTGRPPKIESLFPQGNNVSIPVNFEWENVPGAKSYIFKIQGPELDLTKTIYDIDRKPKISLGFPENNIRQEKTYSWQVKTCARRAGKICGDWSFPPKTFTTFKLGAPINPFPKNNQTIYTYQMPKTFSWDTVPWAKHYKLTINYTRSPEELDVNNCPEGQIMEKILPKNSTSKFINFHCLGTFQWQVQACLDKNCQEKGITPSIWNFYLLAKEVPEELRGGLIPCGRKFNDPNTGWDETKPCGIKHIFLLVQIIINFVLWTIVPIILALLVTYTGIIFYLSLSTGSAKTLSQVKSLWRAAGIGLGIIFFSWMLINLILSIFGFQITIFGNWYEIPI
ncbi:MAG: pilin [Candidatus Nealsonbacteria bacterium]|nr:pilin [Candidatus Nealsonbacteria bacterium]